jgi:hypothetical protein
MQIKFELVLILIVFNTSSKPTATANERIFSEIGRILEARRQLLNSQLLDSLVFFLVVYF